MIVFHINESFLMRYSRTNLLAILYGNNNGNSESLTMESFTEKLQKRGGVNKIVY